jgi:hypothetical protein|tara:strand:+ start:1302 stop:1505 length:204 start_codon:yes stop_codon:yes gene_type:complete
MNKFNGHEAYLLGEALDLYVNKMNEEITQAEEAGKRPIFTTSYFPQIAKDMKWKIKQNTYKQDGDME